jgi:CubicO group peptidase (beta-lactamase class C family)
MVAQRGMIVAVVVLALAAVVPSPAWGADTTDPTGPLDQTGPSDKAAPPDEAEVSSHADGSGPPTVAPGDIVFQPRTLRTGSPVEVGLLPDRVARMSADAAAYLEPTPDHPTYPSYGGAVVLAAKDGVIVQHAAVGHALRYSGTRIEDGRTVGVELPPDQWVEMREDTIFDMASVSKLFTTVVALQLVEQGQLSLDEKVTRYIPEFGANGKAEITVRQLLTHTSGMRAWLPLYSAYPTPQARISAVYASTLQPGASPGNQYIYSDLGLITLGTIVERLTGMPLDRAVAERITGPLGMTDTRYNPPAALHHRVAATEEQPWAGRPLIRGEVHDENAWSLAGVAGHAGIFSTATDLAVFCQMLLNGGRYGATRILAEETVRAALANYNAGLEARYPESDRGLGFELNKHWYMGPLASPVGFGHTGYTGTSLSIDPISHSFVVFLTNRVHPSRNWGGNNQSRRAMARDFGEAMPVRPAAGTAAWRAEPRDAATVTLTAALDRPTRAARLSFALWYDTEPRYDRGRLEMSVDGGATWSLLPFSGLSNGRRWTTTGEFTGYAGRAWAHADADLPDGVTHVRWRSVTDGNSQGRGVYIDGVLVAGPDGVLLNSETPDGVTAFTPDGWNPATT